MKKVFSARKLGFCVDGTEGKFDFYLVDNCYLISLMKNMPNAKENASGAFIVYTLYEKSISPDTMYMVGHGGNVVEVPEVFENEEECEKVVENLNEELVKEYSKVLPKSTIYKLLGKVGEEQEMMKAAWEQELNETKGL